MINNNLNKNNYFFVNFMMGGIAYKNSITFPDSPVSFYYNALSSQTDSKEKDAYFSSKNTNDNANKQISA